MNDDQMRLECLKLAHDWGKMRFTQGYAGIGIDDVVEKAAEYFRYCTGFAPPSPELPRVNIAKREEWEFKR